MHQETFELNCSRTSLALDSTLVVVVEMSLSTWLVCAEVPGVERRAMRKMSVDEAELLSQLRRWRDESLTHYLWDIYARVYQRLNSRIGWTTANFRCIKQLKQGVIGDGPQ